MTAIPTDEILSLGWLLGAMIYAGAFGGLVSSLFELYNKPEKLKEKKWYYFTFLHIPGKCLIGIAGTFGVVFLSLIINSFISTKATVNNKVLLISLFVVSGIVSFKLLPKIGNKLEKQLLQEQVNELEEKADRALENSQNSIDYSAAVSHAETALGRTENIDIQQAIDNLISIKNNFKTNRLIHIYLGRLYRRLSNFDQAIVVLRDFIKVIDEHYHNKRENSQYIIDRSDACYNISCYHSLKAKQYDAEGKPPAEISRLRDEAFVALTEAVSKFPTNCQHAKSDEDFSFIKDDPRFERIVGNCEKSS